MDFLKFLTCIDTDEGLLRVNDDIDFYREMLIVLHKDFNNSPAEFISMMKKERIVDARILIHSVKGVAGNLGARSLHASASALEKHVKEHPAADSSQLFEKFERDHRDVMREIEASGILNRKKPELPLGTSEELILLLQELKSSANARKASQVKKTMDEIRKKDWSAAGDIITEGLSTLSETVSSYRIREVAEQSGKILEILK